LGQLAARALRSVLSGRLKKGQQDSTFGAAPTQPFSLTSYFAEQKTKISKWLTVSVLKQDDTKMKKNAYLNCTIRNMRNLSSYHKLLHQLQVK